MPQCFRKVHTDWDEGYFEDLIDTFGLKLTVHYLSDYEDRIEELMKQSPRKPVVFYGYTPDPFIAKHSFPRVHFPMATAGCRRDHNKYIVLNESKLYCDFEVVPSALPLDAVVTHCHFDTGYRLQSSDRKT